MAAADQQVYIIIYSSMITRLEEEMFGLYLFGNSGPQPTSIALIDAATGAPLGGTSEEGKPLWMLRCYLISVVGCGERFNL